MTTGERIRQKRKAAGLTQEELGRKMGISGSAVGQFEKKNSNPNLSTIRKIAETLGCYIGELVSDWTVFSPEEIAKDWSLPLSSLTSPEQEHINKYRCLDEKGQHTVNVVTDMEYDRVTAERKKKT